MYQAGKILHIIYKKEELMKVSELRQKEIINVRTGKRLGNIMDLDIDTRSGRIVSVTMPQTGSRFSLLSKPDNDVSISWEQIKKIGDDVILVETME